MKAIYYTHYNYNPFGDGGFKRTSQIIRLLDMNHIKYDICDEYYTLKQYNSFHKSLYAFKGSNYPWNFITSKNIRANIEPALSYYAQKMKNYDVVFWDSGINTNRMDYLIPYAAKSSGKKVIAICHNLDSLVPGNKSYLSGKYAPDWLQEEIAALRCCHRVICISREDTWLLKLHGIQSEYMPYDVHDIPELKKYYEQIKQQRATRTSGKSSLLLLGSAHNTPTYIGMKEILEKLKGVEMKVAGYGTEKLMEYDKHNIEILGSVNTQKLAELLTCTDAAIVHTNWSSGALTRISELVCAGVPVIANEAASRSYNNLKGVHTYSSVEEIPNLLNRIQQEYLQETSTKEEVHVTNPSKFLQMITD